MYPIENWRNIRNGYVFGQKTSYNNFHVGTDKVVPTGTPVKATLQGKLSTANGKEGGKTITITGTRYATRDMHMSEFTHSDGFVARGADIGLSGNTGELTTGPHLHHDCWEGPVNLKDLSKLIDPEDFGMTIKVLVIGDREYDLHNIEEDNPFIEITQVQKTLSPIWVEQTETDVISNGEVVEVSKKVVDNNWFDLNVSTAGYDIIALVTKDYQREGTNGYCSFKQRLGAWRCVVSDTGKLRLKGKGWRKDNQVAGTLEHEIHHALYHGCHLPDKTHDYDKGEGFPFIRGMKRFQGWELKGRIRLFKRKDNMVIERIVNENLYAMYPQLWSRFGFTKEI